MLVYGIDFTSRPKRTKPITCIECGLNGDILNAGKLTHWYGFSEFEQALQRPGPWIAGLDFPFAQSRRFIENIGWPRTWSRYVSHVDSLGREGFRRTLNHYRLHRAKGDKEHRRQVDTAAGAISPQKLYGTPVALMFFEGAPRLKASGVTIPGLHEGDPKRVVVEAYPGILARFIIGRCSYKQDSKPKQTKDQKNARIKLLRFILDDGLFDTYGLHVTATTSLVDDPGGDDLDALLCAIQAAWAWRQRERRFGAPANLDPLEGWIADPLVRDKLT